MLALSKVYDPADFDYLSTRRVVDRFFEGSGQHALRRWEYAMALHALKEWRLTRPDQTIEFHVADVGGAGSPLPLMTRIHRIIDPKPPYNLGLDTYMTVPQQELDDDGGGYNTMFPSLFNVVFCISVLEHVEDLDQFCYHLSCLVAPGGLLFLTMDYQPEEGPDEKMFHWDRKRIFAPIGYGGVVDFLRKRDFQLLDGQSPDLTWHGGFETWGYAAASLALVKRS